MILPPGRPLCDNTEMRSIDLTLTTPAENLALDEALLDWAEDENPEWEFVRVWESPQPIVVVGRSSRVNEEVHAQRCAELAIPILRRSSGGAAVVAGPGCLMYAVVLSYQSRPALRDITRARMGVGASGRRAASAGCRCLVRRYERPCAARPVADRRSQILWQQSAGQAQPFAISWHAALRLRPVTGQHVSRRAAAPACLSRGALTPTL